MPTFVDLPAAAPEGLHGLPQTRPRTSRASFIPEDEPGWRMLLMLVFLGIPLIILFDALRWSLRLVRWAGRAFTRRSALSGHSPAA